MGTNSKNAKKTNGKLNKLEIKFPEKQKKRKHSAKKPVPQRQLSALANFSFLATY